MASITRVKVLLEMNSLASTTTSSAVSTCITSISSLTGRLATSSTRWSRAHDLSRLTLDRMPAPPLLAAATDSSVGSVTVSMLSLQRVW